MRFDAFERSCWDWALCSGSNANKGKKKNNLLTRSLEISLLFSVWKNFVC